MSATGPVPAWRLEGAILGACNCDWGCPCNFDAPPTYGHCEGVYVLGIREGHFGEVDLGGVNFAWPGHSPGPIHEGGGSEFLILDERDTAEQHEAIRRLWRGGGVGSPFDEFASVRATVFDTVLAKIDLVLDGIRSRVRVRGDADLDLRLSPIVNPVTGDEEELYLDKPTGFTSTRSEMGMSAAGTLASAGITWDITGKYAEYAEFSYAGP
ncbi:MAG: DUF1326 domain-containing protein [Actinobacteria bacterium]|nr:DUF1326 domain-containing protein [Actinomycetota bacterium]